MDRAKLLQNPLPVDRVAARVVRSKGVHWRPHLPPEKVGPGCNLIAPPVGNDLPPQAPDHTGVRRGRLVAFRYLSRGKWVMRCDCGAYEHRDISKWVQRVLQDACHDCDAAHKVRTGEWYSRKYADEAPC